MSIYKNDINVSLNIGANTQQAQQQIQALQASLNKLSSASIGSNIAPNIQKAAAAAQELQMHLQKAYDTKTGNLDLSLLNRSLATSKEGIQGLSASLINAGKDGQAAFTNLARSIASANQPMLKTNTLLSNLWTTMKNTIRWQFSSSALQGFMGSIQKAYGYAQDLNESLTDIRIVTGYSADKMSDFAVEANKAAKALSTTTNEYAKASLIYFQQGLNDQEVKERTDVTVKMANVTRDSAQEVSDQMTAIWNNFDDGSKSLEYYADVITALGAATASSTDEISQGLEKFAAVASTVGLSYEYATSALATITAETRQSADVVGTALKTLFARIQGLSLGETLDDGTDLNKYSEALAKVGISIKDSNGGLKDMDALLEEMAAKWQTLNKDQQVALAQTVAGVRQYAQLVALMDNWDAMQANLKTAANSEGTLQEQQDIYAESWEAASKRAKAALEEIYSALLDDKFFIKLTNTFTELTNGIGEFIKGLGGIKGVIFTISSILLMAFANKIPTALNTLKYNFSVLFGGAKTEAEKMNTAFTNTIKNAISSKADFTEVQKIELTNTQELIKIRENYNRQSSKMTEEERMRAEIAIDGLEKQSEAVVKLAQKKEELSQKINAPIQYSERKDEDFDKLYNKNADREGVNAARLEGEILTAKKVGLEAAEAVKNAWLNGQKTIANSKAMKPVIDELNQLKNHAPQSIGTLKSSFEAYLKIIPDGIKNTENFKKALQKINEATNKNQAKLALEEIIALLDKGTLSAGGMERYLKEMAGGSKFLELDSSTKLYKETLRQLEEQLKSLRNQQKSLKDSFVHVASGFETLSRAIGGASSLAMGINSLNSFIKTMSDPDISGIEKWSSALMQLSMGLSMIVAGGKSLSAVNKESVASSAMRILALKTEKENLEDLKEEEIAKILVEKLGIDAKTAAGLASDVKSGKNLKEAMTQKGLNLTLKEQIALQAKAAWGWITSNPILVAAGIALAAIVTAIVLINKESKKLQEELEATNKAIEQMKTISDEAAQSYDNLKASITDYKDALKSINELTKGTEEFQNAIDSANKTARDLIDTYGIVEGITFEDGLIKIDENILEKKKQETENQWKQTDSYLSILQNSGKLIENQIAEKEILGKIKEDSTYYTGSRASTRAVTLTNQDVLTQSLLNEDLLNNIFYNGGTEAEWKEKLSEQFGWEDLTQAQDAYLDSLIKNKDALFDATLSIIQNENEIETAQKLQIHNNLQGIEEFDESEYQNEIVAYQDEKLDELIEIQKAEYEKKDDYELRKEIQELVEAVSYENKDGVTKFLDAAGETIFEIKNDEMVDHLAQVKAYDQLSLQALNDIKDVVTHLEGLDGRGLIYAQAVISNDPTKLGFDIAYEYLRDEHKTAVEASNLMNELLKTEEDFDFYASQYGITKEDYAEEKDFKQAVRYALAGEIETMLKSQSQAIEGSVKNKIESEIENTSFDSQEEKDKYIQDQTDQFLDYKYNLNENDRTYADQINITEGDWDKQLDSIKSDAILSETASKYELDPDIIKEQAEAYRELYPEIYKTEEAAIREAIATQRIEKGVTALSENWEDWSKTIKNANEDLTGASKTTTDYIKTINELTDVIADLTSQDDLELSKEFFETAENIELIGKAAKGSEKAIAKLGVAVQKDLVKNIKLDKKMMQNMVKNNQALLEDVFSFEDLEKNCKDKFERIQSIVVDGMDKLYAAIDNGAKAGTDLSEILGGDKAVHDWIAAMNEIAIITGMSVDDMNETLQGLHLEAEVTATPQKITHKVPVTRTYSKSGYDKEKGYYTESWPEVVRYEDVTEERMIAQIATNGANQPPPKITYTGVQDVSPSASGSSSGGGSDSSAEPLEYEDEIERYHENTRAIERLTRALDKVSTAKDRAFGKERLRLIDEEIAATERLVAQQRALLHETKEYLKQDFAEIQQYGFTFDEHGEITNYDEVMKQQIDKYNAAVASGNQDAIDAAKKEYDEFKENMQQYEETLTAYEEAQAQLQEYINQVVDLKLEKITTEVEIKILVNDKELTRLEYLLRKIEYEGKGAADAISLMGRQFEQINEKAKPIQEAIDKIYEQARAEGRGLLEEEVMEIKSFYEDGVISSEEEKRIQEIYDKAASEDRMLTQAEEEQIQEYKEQLLELNEEVMDLVETVEGKFMETLEELNGKVDESIGRFATYTGMFQTLSDVITLSGKAGSKYGMDMLNTLSARTVANASAAMRSNLQSYEALDKIYQDEQANLERAIKTGDERLIKQYTERLHEVEMMRETSYDSMLSSWSEALQAANDLFDTKLTNMITSLKQNLGDIDKLVEIYDRAVELEDLYVSGNKSIYELSKLARDIGKDIDKTTNIIAKNKLAGLLEQINKLRAEGVKLSQYDLEYWQAKYELELAEIALQEAQEAKAQVKLTRNTAGGWGYVYTADAEAISEAQQNYEDSLYNMQELHDEYIKDYSERLIKNRQELVNALQDLDKTSLTFEEDALRLKEHHFKQEEYLIDELNKAYQRAGIFYQDTLLAQTYGGASLEDSHTNFINSVVKMIQDELLPGYREFQESVDDINSQAGTTVEDAMDKIFESSMTMEDEVIKNINDLTSGVKEVSDEIWNFQETYGEAIAKMLQDNEDYYSKTIKMYQNFMSETEADKWLQYYDDMRSPGEVLGLAGSGTTGAMAGNGSTAITNGAFGGILDSIIGKGKDSTTYPSRKEGGSGTKVILGKGAPEGMLLNSDGTNGGITVISPGEKAISYPQIRAARDLKGSGNGDLSGYDTDGDGALNENELSKALKTEGIDPKDEKYNKESDKKRDPTQNGTFATGGYTGSWGPEGRWAMLHEKELVLNKFDTENMLDMVNTLRDIDWRAKLSELWSNIEEKFITPIFGGTDELLQTVQIEANFPSVIDKNELEEAFNNLINTASQYANRRRY